MELIKYYYITCSIKFRDGTWKVNDDRKSTWMFSYDDSKKMNLNWSMQCNEGSPITTPTKNQLELMEVEERSTTTPIKDQLERMKIGEASTSRPTEEFASHLTVESFANQSKAESAVATIESDAFSKVRLRPKLKTNFETVKTIARRKSEKRPSWNRNNETLIKKSKDYQDVLELRTLGLTADTRKRLLAISAARGRVDPQTARPENPTAACRARTSWKTRMFCRYSIYLLLSTILVVSLSVFLYEIQETRKHSNDFASAVVELKKRIYGQDKAVQKLSEYLQRDVPSSRVIVLVGGTGVGKSYTVEIIRKNFSKQYAIRQYFPPIEAVWDFNLPLVYPNLIILENLREHDLPDVINFLKTREDTYKNRLVTILAVFNFEQIEDDLQRSNHFHDMHEIRTVFMDQNIEVEIIPYNPLSEDDLEMCIMEAIKESKLPFTERQFEIVKYNLLRNEVGCKGAYRQVQVIGRQRL